MNQHQICLKQIGFFIFDMNSDNTICEYDLFSMVRNFNDSFFIDCLNQDIKDIRSRMEDKQPLAYKIKEEMGIKEDDKNFQINDITKFLQHQ